MKLHGKAFDDFDKYFDKEVNKIPHLGYFVEMPNSMTIGFYKEWLESFGFPVCIEAKSTSMEISSEHIYHEVTLDYFNGTGICEADKDLYKAFGRLLNVFSNNYSK